MWQFLLGAVPFMAPFYLLALAYLEGAVYLSRGLRYLAPWTLAAIAVLLCIEYWFSGSSYVREAHPLLSFLVILWIVSVPVLALSAASLLILRVGRHAARQILILGTVALVVFFWPWFALHSVCASGLDCL